MLIIDGNSIYEVDLDCLRQKHLDYRAIYGSRVADMPEQNSYEYEGRIIKKERYTGKDVGVAILDTGVYPHPDFKNRITAFQDMIHKKSEPYDTNGHGTHEAGISISMFALINEHNNTACHSQCHDSANPVVSGFHLGKPMPGGRHQGSFGGTICRRILWRNGFQRQAAFQVGRGF